jgi:4-amino-4-deoxy-L-arabinose transferase-like glycosyltransferase
VTWGRIGLVLAVVVFLWLAVLQLPLPGLHYDEAFEMVPAVQVLRGESPDTFRQNGVKIGGQLYPLMTQDYIGAINTYAAAPFLLVFGFNVTSIRLLGVTIGLVTLLLTYGFARRLLGSQAAAISVLLLAVSPSFVFWSRQGVFVTSVTAAIGVAAAWSWVTWWETKRTRWALIGSFLFGFGLYAKFLFLWIILSLAVSAAVLLVFRSVLREEKWIAALRRTVIERQVTWSRLFLCAAFFALGISPLLIYNVQTGGTISSVGSNLTTSYYGTNNLAFLSNLGERLSQLFSVIVGSQFWYLGDSSTNPLAAALFILSGVALQFSFVRYRGDSQSSRALAPMLVVLFTVVASCATVSALWITHFAVLVPWLSLAIGAGVVQAVRVLTEAKPLGKICSDAMLIGLILLTAGAGVVEAGQSIHYHRSLSISGGLSDHSDAIYELAQWLRQAEQRDKDIPVVAMDWGLAASVSFLTQGSVDPVEAFGYEWETGDQFAERLTGFVGNPSTLYLWRAPDAVVFDRSQEFRQIYQPLNKQEDIVAAFYDRSGKPVYGVTRLVPAGTAVNPPQPID